MNGDNKPLDFKYEGMQVVFNIEAKKPCNRRINHRVDFMLDTKLPRASTPVEAEKAHKSFPYIRVGKDSKWTLNWE